MMDPESLLVALEERGIRIEVEGGRLVADFRDGAMTPELHAEMEAQKPFLLDYLAGKFTVLIRPDPDPLWTDPRPDLEGDSGRWMRLLEAALARDEMLFGMLSVLRQMGARLEIAGPDNRALPGEGPLPDWKIVRGAEMTPEEYDDFRRRYMLRHKEALAGLLAAAPAQRRSRFGEPVT